MAEEKAQMEAAQVIAWGRSVLGLESQALASAAERLGEPFAKAVTTILGCRGRVVVTGLGKSGHVGAKIASTLSSTGTPAFFLHPSEALHGDFGMLTSGDCLLALAYGGETREVVAVAKYARTLPAAVLAITGYPTSSLAQQADVVLDGGIDREADTLGLAPTSSSTLCLALGDALAVALMHCRGFTQEHFASLHPGGRLGRSLAKVSALMHPGAALPLVNPQDDFHTILEAVTTPNFGLIAVVAGSDGADGPAGQMVGVLSDGDLRRALLQHGAKALTMAAGALMNPKPKTIGPDLRAEDAIAMMERHKITGLFVACPQSQQVLGLVRLHDLLAAKIL